MSLRTTLIACTVDRTGRCAPARSAPISFGDCDRRMGANHGLTAEPRLIVIVENDPVTLSSWTEILRDAGYAVIGVKSFEDGRDALEADPSLLMVDVRLGVYNGLQLVMRAKARTPDLPVIVVTGFADAVIARDARRFGAICLDKPIDADQLLSAIASALERRRGEETTSVDRHLAATGAYRARADDRDRRRWDRPPRDAGSSPRLGRAPNPAERAGSSELVIIEDGDVVVAREPAALNPSPDGSTFSTVPQFTVSVRGRDESLRRLSTYDSAIAEGEALTTERRVRLFYVDNGVLTLLNDNRSPGQG